MNEKHGPPASGTEAYIYRPYITIKGIRRYRPNGGMFRIPVSKLKEKK